MKYLLFIFLIFFISCSPQKRLNRIVNNHPELKIRETIIVLDTIFLPKITFQTLLKLVRDSSMYDSLLNEFVKVKSLVGVSSEDKKKQVQVLQKIKKQIISSVVPDTTFRIKELVKVLILGDTVDVVNDIEIYLSSKGITYSHVQGVIKIPYTKSVTTENIDARIGTPFFKDWWFWLFILALLFILRKPIIFLLTSQVKRPF